MTTPDHSGLALLFPGQGSQKPGMGLAFAEAFPVSRQAFEQVDDALGYALSAVVFRGEPAELTRTDRAQPGLYATSMAVLAALHQQMPEMAERVKGMAGHSLGEYSALAAAGSVSVDEGARLLAVRGESMAQAGRDHPGRMMAVLGASLEDVEPVIRQAAAFGVCVLANDNAPGQVILSGEAAALDHAGALVREQLQKKALFLDVSGAFHSPLMAPAAEKMKQALASVPFATPAIPVTANVTAAPVRAGGDIPRLLVEQVCGRVRWRESVLGLYAQGVRTFVEVGSGKVLTGLCARIVPEARALSVQVPQDLEALARVL